ncbi:MAG: FAD-binding protein [Saprospiraceae bacterium]|nr:FAD-binding protein [Saprospiraceae bacterium]
MDKRQFLKVSAALGVGSSISGLAACSAAGGAKNWAGNVTYGAQMTRPKSAALAAQEMQSKSAFRILGSQHSFSQIANSDALLLSTSQLAALGAVSEGYCTVAAGARYGSICHSLYEAGWALENLASLPHISIGGACATATHGSGRHNGCLATAVSEFELITPDGQTKVLDRNDEAFYGALVGLGATGLVSQVTLQLQPSQPMQQVVFRGLPSPSLYDHFDQILSLGHSVSLFTDWQKENVNQVWVKGFEEQIGALPDTLHGAERADRHMHPIDDHSAESCTEQMGLKGPWYERLPHFKMEFTPSSGEELQAEYFVPFANGVQAMQAIEKMGDAIFPHLYISEIRTIAADRFWMSPFYEQDCLAIHFTWKPHTKQVMALLPRIEKALDPYGVRPHWGKLTTMPASTLRRRIPKMKDWMTLIAAYDPKRKLVNKYLKNLIEG